MDRKKKKRSVSIQQKIKKPSFLKGVGYASMKEFNMLRFKSAGVFLKKKDCLPQVGHHIIVDKSSAYGAKRPGFKTQCKEENLFVNCVFICSVKRIKINKRAPIGANLGPKVMHYSF